MLERVRRQPSTPLLHMMLRRFRECREGRARDNKRQAQVSVRVWGLGFGVWGLGLLAWGLGLAPATLHVVAPCKLSGQPDTLECRCLSACLVEDMLCVSAWVMVLLDCLRSDSDLA